MLRIALIILTFVAPFFFPWQITLIIVLGAAFFVPILGLFAGVLTDVLYYVPSAAPMPVATIIGVFIFLLGLVVQEFVKTRIMGA
ncbi:MAG: hypothetical protein AAB901_00350 [Patescibacteria group bacterium]